MKAMVITGHGGPDVFRYEEFPDPALGELDVLVHVQATSINPVDCRVRRGSKVPRRFPLVLGYDVSGTIVALGDRVTQWQVGDKIYGSPNVFRPGANAEYVAIDSRSIARKPATLDAIAAAVMPLVTLTAWESLHVRARVEPGQTILIHAGAGGVGHMAIQLAKLHGCRVITTAGREESIEFCRNVLHADTVINYHTEDVVEQVMELTKGKGCSAILDFVGGDVFLTSMDCLAVNGQLVTIVETETNRIGEKLFLKNATLHYEFMGVPTAYNLQPERQGKMLSVFTNLVESGLLTPHVNRVLSLKELPEGHRLQETGRMIGKIAVRVNES